MPRLLHLSDPHFGTERTPAVDAVVAAAHALAPDLVVLSGDLTQRATRAQFAAAAAFAARLAPLPLRVVPGNHDLPLFALVRRLWRPRARFAAAFGSAAAAPWSGGGVALRCFDSTSRWRHKNGVLDPALIGPAFAAAAPGDLRVAVFHHPLDCRLAQDEANLVRPAAALAAALAAARVDLVLGGHIHDPLVAAGSVRYAGLARAPAIVLAGTCVSRRTRSGMPNSFNLIALDAARAAIEVERWELRGAGFAPAATQRLCLGARGWTPL